MSQVVAKAPLPYRDKANPYLHLRFHKAPHYLCSMKFSHFGFHLDMTLFVINAIGRFETLTIGKHRRSQYEDTLFVLPPHKLTRCYNLVGFITIHHEYAADKFGVNR